MNVAQSCQAEATSEGGVSMRRIDMWKKRTWSAHFQLLAALMVIAGAAAVYSVEAEAAKRQLLVAGGGYTTGSWYMGSVAITEIVNSTNPEIGRASCRERG